MEALAAYVVFDLKKNNKMYHILFDKKTLHTKDGVWEAKGLSYSVTGGGRRGLRP